MQIMVILNKLTANLLNQIKKNDFKMGARLTPNKKIRKYINKIQLINIQIETNDA